MACIVRAYIARACIVRAYIVMAYKVIAYIVMAYIVMASIVMASIVMAYIVMACIVMAYTVMAYIVMACWTSMVRWLHRHAHTHARTQHYWPSHAATGRAPGAGHHKPAPITALYRHRRRHAEGCGHGRANTEERPPRKVLPDTHT